MPMATGKCVLPVPAPRTRTTLCVSSVQAVVAKVATNFRSSGETSKSKQQCLGARELHRAHLVADRAHRMIRALGLQQMLNQPARGNVADTAALATPFSTNSATAPAIPCTRSALSSTNRSVFIAGSLGGDSHSVVHVSERRLS